MFHRNSIACFTQTSRKIMFLLRPSLRPQLHALGSLAGLLLSKFFFCRRCFAMNVLQGLSRGDALSTQQPWFSQKLCCTQNHSFTDQPCLTQVPCPASSASCSSCWVGCFATLSWLHWRAGLVYTRALPCVPSFMLLLGSLVKPK